MTLTKPKRTINRKLLDSYRRMPCVLQERLSRSGVFGEDHCVGDVCAHHIKTRGAGGGDVVDNLLALCAKHHVEIHKIGTYTFMIKYGLEKK